MTGHSPLLDADLSALVDARLRSLLAEVRDRAPHLDDAPLETVWEHAEQTALGGKLVRPILLLRTLGALSGRTLNDAELDVAAAVELLHYAFLLHDDVIDGDLQRRGEANFIARQRTLAAERGAQPEVARRWSRTAGILLGDLLLCSVHQVYARVDLEQACRLHIMDLLQRAIDVTMFGEMVDVGLTVGVVPRELPTVLRMSAHKTGIYTFELPLRTACVLAQAGPRVDEALTAIAGPLGLAYQLQDDLLSVFGDPEVHGKDPLSDLREAKETALISLARSKHPEVDHLLATMQHSPRARVNVREVLEDCGARAEVEALIEMNLAAARSALSEAGPVLNAQVTEVLETLFTILEGRRR